MASKTISGDELAFGRAVLLATDALGMSAEGAFWLRGKDGRWSYFLVTSRFNRIGAREMCLRLNWALAKILSNREIQDLTFCIAAPRERIVKDIRRIITTGRYSSEPSATSVMIANTKVKAV